MIGIPVAGLGQRFRCIAHERRCIDISRQRDGIGIGVLALHTHRMKEHQLYRLQSTV